MVGRRRHLRESFFYLASSNTLHVGRKFKKHTSIIAPNGINFTPQFMKISSAVVEFLCEQTNKTDDDIISSVEVIAQLWVMTLSPRIIVASSNICHVGITDC
jgi:hypothetical protein